MVAKHFYKFISFASCRNRRGEIYAYGTFESSEWYSWSRILQVTVIVLLQIFLS